jgi:hypothetical protein
MASEPSRRVAVTIRIDKPDAGRFPEIVRSLEASGLTQADVHPRFLIVNGSVVEDGVEAFRRIGGVASVRKDRTYRAQT